MKKLFLILILIILSSGCVDNTAEKSVEDGDTVSVNYTVTLSDGTMHDTSYRDVAIENDIYRYDRRYGPITFTVGAGMMIRGIDEGIIGMRENETRTLTIPHEKAYGDVNESLIEHLPITETIPRKRTIPKRMTASITDFEGWFGRNHTVGESIYVPSAGYNVTVTGMNDTDVEVIYDPDMGDTFRSKSGNWNLTVLEVDAQNITAVPDVTEGDTIQFSKYYWNSTVTGITDDTITVTHNPIPDIEFTDIIGKRTKIYFTENEIIRDHNHILAGETLIFEVTLVEVVS
jgi:peptidylprolyl isomerase